MTFHVLTAVSRPDNLPKVARSILRAGRGRSVCWHLRYDLERQHPGGQKLKNDMLDDIGDGWVCFLDDDTLMNGRLLKEAESAAADGYHGLVVSQERREKMEVLYACPENVKPGGIDIGQVVLDRDLIGNHRIPERYDGDGDFLTAVLTGQHVRYLDQVLSYHNRLGG